MARKAKRFLNLTGLISLNLFASAACVDGSCHTIKHPELVQQQQVAANDPALASGGVLSSNSIAKNHVLVFKPDGSKQCDKNPGFDVLEMEKELEGVHVYARQKQPDGKMHAQMCGGPTGKLNVYEIDLDSFAQAEPKGFKKLISPP